MTVYDAVRPLLFSLPAETAHGLGKSALRVVDGTPLASVVQRRYRVEDDRLRVDAFGESFPNPVGVAAGFDKNADVVSGVAALGFGFVEVGGVTAEAQPGNPRPRMFRLREDEAIVNRMGLNNQGADAVGRRLREDVSASVPVGVNLAKSESTPMAEAPGDYRYTYERVAEGGDFFVVNVSCPNSEGFRDLQNKDELAAIFRELVDAGASPLLVKLSPDLPDPAVEDALDLVDEFDLDGVVAVNTTTDRPESLQSPHASETGGLSGKPIEDESTRLVRFVAERTDVPVVGVGGISDAEGAYAKIRAGASLVQLYTALIYEGPSLAHDINRGLLDLLDRDGFDSITDAVGADR